MKLVPDQTAVMKVLPICEEIGLATTSYPNKGILTFRPEDLGEVKTRWLTRIFLPVLPETSVVEVYKGPGYVTYCFLTRRS